MNTHCTQGEFGRATKWLQTIEELERIDASDIHARRLNAKEVITPKKMDFFQSQMDESNSLEEIGN